jgi:hypothetical protein
VLVESPAASMRKSFADRTALVTGTGLFLRATTYHFGWVSLLNDYCVVVWGVE